MSARRRGARARATRSRRDWRTDRLFATWIPGLLPSLIDVAIIERAPSGAPPALSPVRRELLVNRDLPGVDRNLAARREVLDDAVHHLAATADSRGDVVLGQAFGHHSRAVSFHRVLVDELGE